MGAAELRVVGRPLTERAPAKVNLSLHIVGRRADGYHELQSLVAFAGTGDLLSLSPGPALTLMTDGPTAGVAGPDADNLVLRAAGHLATLLPGLKGGAFRLTKRLPVAAGLGGGSSDAAAALRLLARLNGLSLEDERVRESARRTGADVPVCVGARARIMSGIGHDLSAPVALPPLYVVLVNPGVALETKRVFAEIGLTPGDNVGFGPPVDIEASVSRADLLARLRRARNDMEDAAVVLAPVVGHVLAVLAAAPGCRLARMSGSGATCFALFETCHAAARAARVIRRDHPGWWVKPTVLR